MKDLKFDNDIVKQFPLLYRDRYGSMQSTCMVWGFDGIGPGWQNLIWDLSSKLEPLIQKFIDEEKPDSCAMCGCKEVMHEPLQLNEKYKLENGRCLNIHYLPFRFSFKWKSIGWPSKAKNWKDVLKVVKNKYWQLGVVERVKRRISIGINLALHFLHEHFNVTKVLPCHCKKYLWNHPCASQVKSKYGHLCFYMTSATDEMWELIHEAEKKSQTTCEECGAEAELRLDYSWYVTLCEKCAITKEGKRIPTYKEIDKMTDEEYDASLET